MLCVDMRLLLPILSVLHVVSCKTDIGQYNIYKRFKLEDADLGKCHWLCPFEAERVCARDLLQRNHRLFLNHCFLHLHNSCFNTVFRPVKGLSKCKKYVNSDLELQQLKGVLFGFDKNVRPLPLYGRARVLHSHKHGRDTRKEKPKHLKELDHKRRH